ncbi:MAG TPA: hypothetical protein VFU08_11365 [Candidatus Udaeobacter sp.]|nr:hypothetical protein [Candidatus Udaeobacter sp.]
MGKRPALWAFATASFLVISSAALRAQALAPSTLDLASHDQKKADDMVQVITQKSAPSDTDKPIKAITKKRTSVATKKSTQPVKQEPTRAIAKEPTQAIAKEPARTIAKGSARTFMAEPVRPMGQQATSAPTRSGFHFSFKTPEGKKESVPVITQYYPQQIVYPYGKIDRHIDSRLMQAATIAQERAHAHSRSRCWHYVKDALLASGVIESRPKTELARDAAQELVSNYGFKRLSVSDPFSAPVGSVLVYGTARSVGHVELRTRDGFVSDFRSKTPSRRPLLGVYAKL